MAIQDLSLFIGDGNQVAEVNSAGTFDGNVLDLNTPYRITTLIDFELDLLIGTTIASTVNKTRIFRWDTVSESWNTSDTIEEQGINAFIRDDNYLYVNAGQAGNLYFYNGEQLLPFKRVPGIYTSTAYGSVNPNAVGNLMGVPVFGFSNGSGNPAKQGVYRFGSYSRDYSKILDLSWPISTGVMTAVEIGAIVVAGFDLLVSWKDSTSTPIYGVDAIDWSNKYASAYFETRMLFEDKRDITKTLEAIRVLYQSLPASTGFTISYAVNHAAYVAMTDVTDADFNAIKADLSVPGVGALQIKVGFDVSSNNAPTMEALDVILSK